MSAALMIQGTGSDVGKSLLVAGIARALSNQGLKVMPFKPQNMSNNAAVTSEGGEIGRAQALQARAARTPLLNDMNPVLLKPQSETGAQIIVQGKVWGQAAARQYQDIKQELLPYALDSFNRLKINSDIVLVEGAGSPAEINLRKNDIANMGFAEAADIPVVLAGDIDRGGVIAQLVGTHALLSPSETSRTKAFIINKFRGDTSLFSDGLKIITEKTGWNSLGIVPYFKDAHKLPPEDALSVYNPQEQVGTVNIAVVVLSRISNHDDFDPLATDPDVNLIMVRPGTPIPPNMDLIILPGSKSTIDDMKFLTAQGWDIDIKAHLRQGGSVLGICGGYQMLGNMIRDPMGIESSQPEIEGLGLLDFETEMHPAKTLLEETGIHLESETKVSGYHMHLGKCVGPALSRPFLNLSSGDDGCVSENGQVMGTYLHGLFQQDQFRQKFLNQLRPGQRRLRQFEHEVEESLNGLAAHLKQHLDMNQLMEIAGC
ncbi:cobyric acid synthase [Sneathiella limimaris]|uniref:cobyric acid synthase n=1 Tax=Sneathiella limimaris TaxID=1964213 RepID=UPI00146D8A16|nr:cobyric acid synthase [Sneathiella limimaris]